MKVPLTLKQVLGSIFFGVASLSASSVTLFNTGVGGPAGSNDTHWTIATSPYGISANTVVINGANVLPATSVAGVSSSITTSTTWDTSLTGANWIAPINIVDTCSTPGVSLTSCAGANIVHVSVLGGTYDYREFFDLSSFAANTTSISGFWEVDGIGADILLNGHSLNLQTLPPLATVALAGSYARTTAFTIDNTACPGCFNSGINSLVFRVVNGASESGVQVKFTNADATLLPEPGTWFSLVSGLGVLALYRRQRR